MTKFRLRQKRVHGGRLVHKTYIMGVINIESFWNCIFIYVPHVST